MKDQLDAILQAGVDRAAAAGVTAVVVDASGVLYEGAFGERVIGSGIPMENDTVGAIFSMTKALTAACAMQLVEQGKVDLDAPAGDVCPTIAEAQVLDGFDDDGQPITRPPSTPVTLRHLLTHTSGYVYTIWNENSTRWHEVTGVPDILSLEKVSLTEPLAFDPGTQWQYGIGLDWVGQMIEAISGMTLGEYMTTNLLTPLGMTDTAFAHSASMLERASGVHARMPDGSLAPIDVPGPENPEFEMGGGGLHGTMRDYARFLRMMLNDGELDGVRVLQAETVQTMSTNHIGDLRVTELKTQSPGFSTDAEFFPGDPKTWGLSFQINEVPGSTGRPAGTLMWAGLANSFYWIDRENQIAGCYLSQMLPFGDEGTVGLFMEMEKAVYESR